MVEREREVDLPLKPVLYHYTKIQVVVRMLLFSLGSTGLAAWLHTLIKQLAGGGTDSKSQ
jgi:hypothetical protein